MNLCEDAHFIVRVGDNSEVPEMNSEGKMANESVYVGVADGVGDWRQYDVDPKEFSHSLVRNAERIVKMDSEHRAWSSSVGVGFTVALGIREQEAIHPLDVIIDAWTATLSENVVGSSTLCVATLDDNTNTLSYSNIGDSGVMVVRRIDPLMAGSTQQQTDAEMQIVFLSQQQLKGFNLPYQLGFSNKEGHPKNFNSPSDADTGSIPVLPGDVIVIATDGLFDNVGLDDILDEIKQWEDKYYPGGLDSQSADAKGDSSVNVLAENLVRRARELSIDTSVDSPFALLAKENDILWGGGMPDDTTVVAMRVHLPKVVEEE
jgi:protein phosphatase PTC7